MAATDDQLRRNAELKLWIENKIAELQDEMERLKEALAVVDSALRASSFRPASEVSVTSAREEGARAAPKRYEAREEPVPSEIPEMRELRRDKGGSETIAVAQVTAETVKIEPVAEVVLKEETPPFKSFLLGKILGGMKTSDEESSSKGKLKKGSELRYTVASKSGKISSLTVENYRDKERLNEILSTTAWTFSRMLEK